MPSDPSTDHWDFYTCEIKGKPHSIMVNLSLFKLAPMPKLNLYHRLEIGLNHPDPKHKMTTNEEFQRLREMEDLILESKIKNLRYIARQTGNGKRKFHFYASQEVDFASFTDTLYRAFPDYEQATFSFEDVHWKAYFEYLYPNAIGMNEISNRAVCLQLEAHGDNLDIVREIDHTIIFKNYKQARAFAKIAEEKGFTVDIKTSGIFRKTYELLVQRVDPPSHLDSTTYELEKLAEELGGSYDGWGCKVQTSSD